MMTRSYKIAKGGEAEIRAYVKRSNELWRNAARALDNQEYDACVIMAIHACISLADATCIVHQGARYAGSSHDEAVQYFHDLGIKDEGFGRACRRLAQIIGEKTTSEYGGKNLTTSSAHSIYKNGERFREYLFEVMLSDYYSA